MRVIVCGGREYEDDAHVRAVLDKGVDGQPITAIAEGGSDGADAHAQEWAFMRGVDCQTYDAEWKRYYVPGRRNPAGPIRNAQMLREFAPDAVIAFPGGRGTADMIRQARAAGVRVIEVPRHSEGGA